MKDKDIATDQGVVERGFAAAIERTMERLRGLHEYAGRPAWEAVLEEELRSPFLALQAKITALVEVLEEAELALDAAARIINDEGSALDSLAVVRGKIAIRALLNQHKDGADAG